MNTETATETTTTTPTFEIAGHGVGYIVLMNGTPLTDKLGTVRIFATRNTARKRVSRERRGEYHR